VELLASIPRLRAFAVSLSGNASRADDLVQETLVRAWGKLASFVPGTNMAAWLYTILRNEFYSEFRKRSHEVPDPDGHYAAALSCLPSQEFHLEFQDFRGAFAALPPLHREALVLVGACGLSYDEVAGICGCAIGTIKSRVNRARSKLAALLNEGLPAEPDQRLPRRTTVTLCGSQAIARSRAARAKPDLSMRRHA